MSFSLEFKVARESQFNTAGGSEFQVRGAAVLNGSFAVAGPAAWNSLPTHIRNIHTHAAFCRHMKTYLFSSPG